MESSELWAFAGLFVFALFSYAIAACGGAALLFIWFPRLERGIATLLASLFLPLLVGSFVVFLVVTGPGETRPEEVLTILGIACVPGVVVGWPCAFFSIRALHGRIERAGVTAQEMFE